MTTDFHALCTELINDLEEWVNGYLISDPPDEYTAESFERIDRARAALGEPETPDEPVSVAYTLEPPDDGDVAELVVTDEKLLAMRSWSSHGPTFDSDLVEFGRAVLARWGRQPAPDAPASCPPGG